MPAHTAAPFLLATSLATALLPAQGQTCAARSGERMAQVVELYTSEGCSSCPPADRWLSQLPRDPAVVALAFHVDYWDSLGWTDRFASPAFTQRQAEQRRVNGARFSYTPQLVVNGQDRPDWPRFRPTSLAPAQLARVQLELQRNGDAFEASVQTPRALRLAAYWAVTEDRHQTAVRQGENAGATLQHAHVVREYLPVPPWATRAGEPTALRFSPGRRPDPAHPQQVVLVVTDADSGLPLQALALSCPAG